MAPRPPSSRMRMDFGCFSAITWVARMCSSSLVPQPKASAPSPPTVGAWLSGTASSRPAAPCRARARPRGRCPARDRRGRTVGCRAVGCPRAWRGETARRRDCSGRRAPGGSRPVILHRDGQVGPPHRTACLLEALEGVRRMQLMQHVTVDIDQLAAVRTPRHAMGVPDLVEQRARPNHAAPEAEKPFARTGTSGRRRRGLVESRRSRRPVGKFHRRGDVRKLRCCISGERSDNAAASVVGQ